MMSVHFRVAFLLVVILLPKTYASSASCSYSESLEDRLQAIEDRLDKIGCESGLFGRHGGAFSSHVGDVKFTATFDDPPVVTYGLYLLDTDKNTNLRLKVTITKITKTGFSYRIEQWNDTKLYGARISWMACPTRKI